MKKALEQEAVSLRSINQTDFSSVFPREKINERSTSESEQPKVKANEELHYRADRGVHSKHSIIVCVLAALFFSQRGLKALESQNV